MADNSTIDRKSTGYFAHNGMMHIGDHVLYEDGYLTFRTQIIENDGVYGFFLDNEFYALSEFVFYMSEDEKRVRDSNEIEFTIIDPNTDFKPAKVFRENVKLPDCPVCGKSAQLAVSEDPASFHVECSPGCAAPRCYHLDYHETVAAWTDFVLWHESFFCGYYRFVPMSHRELVLSSGQPILIVQEEQGVWEDVSDGIYSFMDIDDLRLTSDQLMNMENFGRTWLAFRRLSETEIEERNRPINLLSKRRALKHCIEVLERLQGHNSKAFRNDPHLWKLVRDMLNVLGATDELLDKILWQ